MRRVSRLISDRRKLADRLRATIGAYAEPLAKARAKLVAPGLAAGESLPDGELEIELLIRLLDRRLADLEAAERRYRDHHHDLKRLRAGRDRAAKTMNREIQALRRKVEAVRGSGGAAEILKLTGRTRRRAPAIHAQARWAVAVLRGLDPQPDPEARPPTAGDGDAAAGAAVRAAAWGVAPSRVAEWRQTVEPAFKKLDTWIERTDELDPVVDRVRFNRDLACGEFDHTARSLVAIAKSYALLVKNEDAVERIRRAVRRRKRPGPKKKKDAAPDEERPRPIAGSKQGEPPA